MSGNHAVSVLELGIPVRAVFHCQLHPGADSAGNPSLLVSMGQHAGGFLVLEVNTKTGDSIQHECLLPNAYEASAAFRSPRTGILYLGSCDTGYFHRFVPGHDKIEDIGPVDSDHATFACRIDEAPDGSVYIGAYPGCCLSRYVPATEEWTRFGRMDETDMYFYPWCGDDGTVAGLVKMCREHVVALDPATGERRTVGPTFDVQEESGGKISLFRGADGLLYIKSSEGHFLIRGLDAIPVSELPEPEPVTSTMPDGSKVAFADGVSFDHRQLRVTNPDGQSRVMDLNWKGKGTSIFLLHLGPDNKLCGSSILPEHFFSCRLDGSEMIDHGRCSVSNGEAYSMANLDGKLYMSSYPAGRLSIYDPAKPYRFGTDQEANPRDVGPSDPVSCRPRTMVAGPAGKVWIGSIPDYGKWGGVLASYDPETGQFVTHRHLIRDCSVTAMAWLPDQDRLLIGTSTGGGTGTLPRAREAGFVFWNPHEDSLDRIEMFGLDKIRWIIDIIRVDERHVYSVVAFNRPHPEVDAPTVAELILLDLNENRVVARSHFRSDDGWPLQVALRQGPDGACYGATSLAFYRIEKGKAERTILWQTSLDDHDNYITVSGPIVDRTFYFATHHRLRALAIP